jgi:hypothetical protein
MKPALVKAIPERPTGRKCVAPIKRGYGQSGWVAGLIGSQMVVRIGGGKNRALNTSCIHLG